MSVTQFAMVEELASLIKDNLPCKHLVLSMEGVFIDFLQDDTSSDGILELEPMNSYNRLLLHRLAEIFGFAHESVGEGDDRHLILERCPETSIPSILVSDLLWQYDEPQSLTSPNHLLTREEAVPESKKILPSLKLSLEKREAAYLAARERIFAADAGEVTREPVKQRPRNPVVARRMIAHALGQKVNSCSQDTIRDCKDHERGGDGFNIQYKGKVYHSSKPEGRQEATASPDQTMNVYNKVKNNKHKCNASIHSVRNAPLEAAEKRSTSVSTAGRRNGVDKDYSKEEHLGAAKRMFANALGLRAGKDSSLTNAVTETKSTRS